jgi:predicted dehydrogenase
MLEKYLVKLKTDLFLLLKKLQIMTKIRLGVIGGGTNSAVGYAHFVASKMDGHFIYTAGCFSKDEEVNRNSAITYGIEENSLYHSIDELLDNQQKVDCWLVLLPTPAHFNILKRLSTTGKPVICEKALCSTPEQTKEVISLYPQEDLYVIFNYTGYPMVREGKEMILKGVLGDLTTINMVMPQSGFIKRDASGEFASPQPWRMEDGPISTLSLDLGVHVHSLIKFVCGVEVDQVFAVSNTSGLCQGIIDNVSCTIKLSNNAIGNIWYSKTALGNTNGLSFEIYGTSGSLKWKQLNPDELIWTDKFNSTRIIDRSSNELKEAYKAKYNRFKAGHPTGFIEALSNYYASIYSSITGADDGYLFNLVNAQKGIELMKAIELSIEKNKLIHC